MSKYVIQRAVIKLCKSGGRKSKMLMNLWFRQSSNWFPIPPVWSLGFVTWTKEKAVQSELSRILQGDENMASCCCRDWMNTGDHKSPEQTMLAETPTETNPSKGKAHVTQWRLSVDNSEHYPKFHIRGKPRLSQ